MSNTLTKKVKVTTTMKLLSGIHIGDSKESVEIGGVDSPVVRRKDNQQPYIPGSSIKGKMRCLLEQMEGATDVGNSPSVNNVFGIANRNETKRSKIIFRDAYLTKDSVKMLENSPNTDMPYTEIKFENTIDRVLGAAKGGGIRKQERIPAGSIFEVEFVINVFNVENDEQTSKEMLQKGIKALQNDYLGGSGSRGYGQIEFGELNYEDIIF